MNNLVQENGYVVAEDTDGRLYFYIGTKEDDPQKYPDPKIVYDGKEHAILQRKPAQDIVLDYINEDIRAILSQTHSVMVIESANNDITQTYYANMEHVEKLPVEINI